MKFRFNELGQEWKGEVQKVGTNTWVYLNGKTYCIENPESGFKRKKKTQSSGSGSISAPMPGRITRLLKKTGDRVVEGDTLIVMEAMKMEYNLKSEITGVIEKISCKVADSVSLGQELALVKVQK